MIIRTMMRRLKNMVSGRVVGVIASIAVLLSLTMCETDYCNENMFIVGTMRVFVDNDKEDVLLVTLDEEGNPISMVLNTNGGYANFSLNPKSDTSRFCVLDEDTVEIGRIAIVHTNTVEFINAECGVRTLSKIDTVLIENAVEGDSVAILNRDVDENYDNGNLEIYFADIE